MKTSFISGSNISYLNFNCRKKANLTSNAIGSVCTRDIKPIIADSLTCFGGRKSPARIYTKLISLTKVIVLTMVNPPGRNE